MPRRARAQGSVPLWFGRLGGRYLTGWPSRDWNGVLRVQDVPIEHLARSYLNSPFNLPINLPYRFALSAIHVTFTDFHIS